ncbi:MAG: hypothetical protein AAF525_13995 [Pseudomonadota bacterium]
MTCTHLIAGDYPFDIEFVLDAYFGIADTIIQCKTCRARYLLNLIDWVAPELHERTFSIRLVDDDVFRRFTHNVSREYCDLARKAAEVHSLTSSSILLDKTMTLNVNTTQLIRIDKRTENLPTQSWRQRLF